MHAMEHHDGLSGAEQLKGKHVQVRSELIRHDKPWLTGLGQCHDEADLTSAESDLKAALCHCDTQSRSNACVMYGPTVGTVHCQPAVPLA